MSLRGSCRSKSDDTSSPAKGEKLKATDGGRQKGQLWGVDVPRVSRKVEDSAWRGVSLEDFQFTQKQRFSEGFEAREAYEKNKLTRERSLFAPASIEWSGSESEGDGDEHLESEEESPFPDGATEREGGARGEAAAKRRGVEEILGRYGMLSSNDKLRLVQANLEGHGEWNVRKGDVNATRNRAAKKLRSLLSSAQEERKAEGNGDRFFSPVGEWRTKETATPISMASHLTSKLQSVERAKPDEDEKIMSPRQRQWVRDSERRAKESAELLSSKTPTAFHIGLRKGMPKNARVVQREEPPAPTGYHSTSQKIMSLAEDLHRSTVYQFVYRELKGRWKQSPFLCDRMFDVMKSAVKDELADASRPVLTNELRDFENPYMLKRAAMQNVLQDSIVQTQAEERTLEEFLDEHPSLLKLRFGGRMPAEVVEPLMAFRGDISFSTDPRTRLKSKLDAVSVALSQIGTHEEQDGSKGTLQEDVISVLPENLGTDGVYENHPFKNHLGFQSQVPLGVTGGIKKGKPLKHIQRELRLLRYPTLQRVAHSLPRDPTYRAAVVHAIRFLERSRGWDFESKIKAINSLKEVFDNLGNSELYKRRLDTMYPMLRKRGMVKYTFNRISRRNHLYERTLTTQNRRAIRNSPRNYVWYGINIRRRVSRRSRMGLVG